MKPLCFRILIFALITILPEISWTADVVDIEQAYIEAVDSAEEPIFEFHKRYVEELEKLKGEVQADGNLEGVIAIQSEIENFTKAIDRDYSAVPGLERLRGIYEESSAKLKLEINKNLLSILGKTITKLDELKIDLTKRGEIKSALRADETRKRLIERRGELTGASITSAPATQLWSLRSRSDFDLIKDCKVEREDEAWILTSEVKAMSNLQTDKEFKPPFVARFRASTDKVEIRFFWDGNQIVIFNWSSNPQQLRIQNPNNGRAKGIQDKGYLQPGELHDIKIQVDPAKIQVFANGELRGELDGDFGEIEGPFGIGPAFGSTVTVEQFDVNSQKDAAE